MKVPVRLSLFGLLLGGILVASAALGAAVGPLASDNDADEPRSPSIGGGLVGSAGGFTLTPLSQVVLPARQPSEWSFRITDADGSTVREFEVAHEKELHLIVVDRGLSSYAHLHPQRDASGTWTVDLPGMSPGVYRAFADVVPADGPALTLGADLSVPGDFTPAESLEPTAYDEVDGIAVRLGASDLVAGQGGDVELSVARDGEPVSLDPYLGARGHLVAIREGDLAYAHVHPTGDEEGEVHFAIEPSTGGRYRLFFDFAVDGVVRTASFTVDVASSTNAPIEESDHGGH
jgi:hypothetical protein